MARGKRLRRPPCESPVSTGRFAVLRSRLVVSTAPLLRSRRRPSSPLDSLIQTLRPYPNARIRIEGYTDSDGTSAETLVLSRARASTVRRYLVAHGVRSSNLTAIG